MTQLAKTRVYAGYFWLCAQNTSSDLCCIFLITKCIWMFFFSCKEMQIFVTNYMAFCELLSHILVYLQIERIQIHFINLRGIMRQDRLRPFRYSLPRGKRLIISCMSTQLQQALKHRDYSLLYNVIYNEYFRDSEASNEHSPYTWFQKDSHMCTEIF